MLDLLEETGAHPSAQEVADRAGVSLRTVFRHFDDVDSLLAVAVAHQIERVGRRFDPLGPVGVDAFVAHRAQLFEEISPIRRAALQRSEHPAIGEWLTESRRRLRAQVAGCFDVDGITLDALDAATSWSTWETLRREQGLSVARARAVMSHTVTSLLGAG